MVFALSDPIIVAMLFAEGSAPWWNYPGLELWKFINLAVFIGVAFYLHRSFGKPISEAFRSRRERIKRDLIEARQERDRALEKLGQIEARLQSIDAETATIGEKAKAEAEAEEARLKNATEIEIAKITEQAQREIENTGKVARQELRVLAATHSVELAAQLIRQEIRAEDDERLLKLSVAGLQEGRN